jgi:hypothetical protein
MMRCIAVVCICVYIGIRVDISPIIDDILLSRDLNSPHHIQNIRPGKSVLRERLFWFIPHIPTRKGGTSAEEIPLLSLNGTTSKRQALLINGGGDDHPKTSWVYFFGNFPKSSRRPG